MQRRKFLKTGVVALTGLALPFNKALSVTGASGRIVFKPESSDAILVNPGIGFETFHCFNGDERDGPLENYPECSISYHRFYWDELEPEEGKYNFELLDEIFEKAEVNKQSIALRFMPMSPGIDAGIPKWYMRKGKGSHFIRHGNKGFAPDFNDPYYLSKWEELTGSFGVKYNGNPQMERMEIGGYGLWSEWHISHTNLTPITAENSYRLIDMHLKYWDSVPLMMLTAFKPALIYALENGAGWRVDSLGDYGHFSETWNHMVNDYPNKMENIPLLGEAWKNGPIGYEPPGKMTDLPRYVPSKGGGYDNMWDKALEWHGSVYNAKSGKIPEEMVPGINDFLKNCGYRFVVKKAMIPEEIYLNQRILPFKLQLENIGVAPVYHDYSLAVRLQGNGRTEVLVSSARVKKWLPGKHELDESIVLPDSVRPGEYKLSIGLLKLYNMKPAILFANKDNDDSKWLVLKGKTLRIKA